MKRGEWMGVPVAIKSINKLKKGTGRVSLKNLFAFTLDSIIHISQDSMHVACKESSKCGGTHTSDDLFCDPFLILMLDFKAFEASAHCKPLRRAGERESRLHCDGANAY